MHIRRKYFQVRQTKLFCFSEAKKFPKNAVFVKIINVLDMHLYVGQHFNAENYKKIIYKI